MATPPASRSQAQAQARDQKRVWTGAGRGRAGLGPVAKPSQPGAGRPRSSNARWVYAPDDAVTATSLAFGATVGADVGWVTDSGPWWDVSGPSIILTQPGLYEVYFNPYVTVVAAAGVKAVYNTGLGSTVAAVVDLDALGVRSHGLQMMVASDGLSSLSGVLSVGLQSTHSMSASAGDMSVSLRRVFAA